MSIELDIPHKNSIFISMTKSISFCPELNTEDSIVATEQLMNAFVLNNPDNITNAVKAVTKAKHIYTNLNAGNDTESLADYICLNVDSGGVTLKPYYYAAKQNRAYCPLKTFENYTQKQNLLNLEFLTDYMLKFDGQQVTYLPKFYVMVEELMFKRENNNCHDTSDPLIYEIIQPKCEDLRSDSRNIIYKELHKFNAKYEDNLISTIIYTKK